MKRAVVGILAHVDAGKTSLTEAMLYRGGQLRRLGRVDHRDAFLDTAGLERERGITIFSKLARLPLGETELQLLDTPGHVDFSAETERALGVMDCAVLVVSAADGVQAHTRTLWKLLERAEVPTFLFLNKTDLPGAGRDALLDGLRKLGGGFVDFSQPAENLYEEAALLDEGALERYLERGALSDGEVSALIARRALFPCFFGSALKLDGVDNFLAGLARFAPCPARGAEFGAQIYKISRDETGARLTWLKVTGGVLRVKTVLTNRREGLSGEEVWADKADQLRLYSGDKFEPADEVPAGVICAVTGLVSSRPGDVLGAREPTPAPALEPVLTCQVILPPDADERTVLPRLRELEEEDPLLRVVWQERTRQLHLQVMGPVQLEVLTRLAMERFGLELAFGPAQVLYRETISAPALGIGHYEPLRHYAEVHLLLEPGERGSGLRLFTACPDELLDGHWQRLILTHLLEKEFPGALTGSPITDVKITLVAGKAHPKHTEGGDFRQATYRAVRQGLLSAQGVILEPWYEFRMELPAGQVGRAMSDLQRMGGRFDPPQTEGDAAVLTGQGPVEGLRDCPQEVASYTRGLGRVQLTPGGYLPCADPEGVRARIGYDPERDVDNPADSIFCEHGAGALVKWRDVPSRAHIDSGVRLSAAPRRQEERPTPSRSAGAAGDKELLAIFERTYGKVSAPAFQPVKKPARAALSDHYDIQPGRTGPEYLLVDGYNIIFAWDELKTIARENLEAARRALCETLANYQGFRGCQIIVVFDAYKVKGNPGSVEKWNSLYVVYTKEAETADAYIERTTYDLAKTHRVRVATSDGPEQMIILGHGALRLPALSLRQEVEGARGQIAAILSKNNSPLPRQPIRAAMERAKNE